MTKSKAAKAKRALLRAPKQAAWMRAALKRTKPPQRGSRPPMRRSGLPSAGVQMLNGGTAMGSQWKATNKESVVFPIAKEKVMDITNVGTGFNGLADFYINPGNAKLFPIFANIAKNYEQYKIRHLKFFFRSMEYMASGSVVSAGLVAMATNFDIDALPFKTFTELENYQNSVSAPPWSGVVEHDVVASRKQAGEFPLREYYVDYGNNTPGSPGDKFFDIGRFQMDAMGCQPGTIGELWVEYSFELIKRIQHEAGIPGAAHFNALALSNAQQFNQMTATPGSSMPGAYFNGSTFYFPTDIHWGKYFYYMGCVSQSGATPIGPGPYVTTKVNCITQKGFVNQSALNINATANSNLVATTGPSVVSEAGIILVTAKNASITFNTMAWTNVGNADFYILKIPDELTEDEPVVDPITARLDRLESLLSPPQTPYEECKEEDNEMELEKSVHLTREQLRNMLKDV